MTKPGTLGQKKIDYWRSTWVRLQKKLFQFSLAGLEGNYYATVGTNSFTNSYLGKL